MMKHSYWDAHFPGVGEVFLQAFGKPTPEEWEKMDNKQRVEAVSDVWREQKDFEKQAMGYQFEAVLLKREALEPVLEEVRLWIRQGSMPSSDRSTLRKLVEFIECIDES